jgi:hypothetical protein
MFEQLREGIDFAYRTPQVLLILIVLFFVGTFGYNFSTALPLLAKFVLNIGSVGFGVMTAVLGVGSLMAALAIAYTRRAGERQILLGAGLQRVVDLVGCRAGSRLPCRCWCCWGSRASSSPPRRTRASSSWRPAICEAA